MPAPKIILIVDDEPAILGIMKEQLEREGYAAMTARTEADALDIIDRTQLLVVLLDLNIDGTDGLEVLKKIKARRPSLPVIIVTGNHQERDGRRAFELGAWDYVT